MNLSDARDTASERTLSPLKADPARRFQPGMPFLQLLVLVVVVLLVAYPLTRLVWRTIYAAESGGFTLAPYQEALSSPITLDAIWGTLWLTTATLLVAVPLAVLLAWITSSTDAPLAKRLAVIPILSLAVPPLVGSIGWLVLLAPQAGLLNILIRTAIGSAEREGPFNAYSLPVIVMVMGLYTVPYIYGPVYAAFNRLDGEMQEAGWITGGRPFTIARTIVLPVLRPAILAGTLIGGVTAASTFVIPLILASGTGLRVLPTLVYQMVNQEGRVEPATALASLLSLFTITGLLFYRRALREGSFVTVRGKGFRPAHVRLGRWRWAATTILLLFVLFAIVLPMLALLYISMVGFWSSKVFEQTLSFSQYARLFDRPFAFQALLNSGWLSVAGATLAVLIGLLVAYMQLRRPGRTNGFLSFLATLPLGIPAIVLGLSVLYSYTGGPLSLYGTPAILILGYCAHMLPIGVRNGEAGLRQISPELEEAALIAGDTTGGVMRRITLPLMLPPLLAAWALAFIVLYRDLPISILMYTAGTIVSSVSLLNIFEQGSLPAAAAYAVVITLVSSVVVWFVMRVEGDSIV